MGEVLRAIMEHNCLDSRVAFYSADMVSQAVTGGANVFARRQASLQLKSDTWFLMMGFTQDNGFSINGGVSFWKFKNYPTAFVVQRASTGDQFAMPAVIQGLQNYNLNNFVTLDEYILWAPGETILISEDATTGTTTGGNPQVDTFVTFQGIEFKMPG